MVENYIEFVFGFMLNSLILSDLTEGERTNEPKI